MKTLCHILLLLLLCVAASCTPRRSLPRENGMYYWRTDLHLDAAERQFLAAHDVRRLYTRFFDVVPSDAGEAVPNATLTFSDSLPEGVGVVPVIYVVNRCMETPAGDMAEKIVERVWQMCETHHLGVPTELQMDCDWTASTRENYFALLTELRRLLDLRGARLSATVRLHQLGEAPPPVDKGILMLYNTGDVTRFDEPQPILSLRAVAPYLRYLRRYDLPLQTAYPIFGWRVLFRGTQFVGIMHSDDDYPVLPGDTIVNRRPTEADVLAVYRAVEEAAPGINRSVLLFDLQAANIASYNTPFYEEVLNP